MKKINRFITEKFKINSKNVNKQDKLSDEEKDKIIDKLCRYFQGSGSFGGEEYDTRLLIVDKFFHKDIAEYFRRLFLWEDMAEYIDISKTDFMTYVKDNRKELYDEINDFVLR